MHLVTEQTPSAETKPQLAARYRAAHQNRLMLLNKLKADLPEPSEFCRILAVETVEPDLWLTVRFLDGSRKGLRPGAIRPATTEEEKLSQA